MNRRTLGLGLLGLAFSLPLGAQRARPSAGFAIDWQGGARTPALVRSMAAQVALVEALPISAEAMAFFRVQPIFIDTDGRPRANRRGVFLAREVVPEDNPVLLHELLHRYHAQRLPGGTRNRDVLRFMEQVRASRAYPADSYMFESANEFFAMNASVALYGRASRPPSTRAAVRTNSPDLYAWIVREFGLRVR